MCIFRADDSDSSPMAARPTQELGRTPAYKVRLVGVST